MAKVASDVQNGPVQPVSELVRVAASLDDKGRGPLGDAAAAAFDRESPVFLRSSSTHVFATRRLVLRVVPDAPGAFEQLEDAAAWTSVLHGAGAPVVRPIVAPGEQWAVSVRWDGTLWWVTAQERMRGVVLDVDDFDERLARRWGDALAHLHEVGLNLVRGGHRLPRFSPVWPATMSALWPTEVLVPVHGDPEPDNVVWRADGDPMFIDLDDHGLGTRASDLVAALRDWATPGSVPDLGLPEVAAFVRGYADRSVAGVPDLGPAASLARAHEDALRKRLAVVVAESSDPTWPDWAVDLHARLRRRAFADPL